MQISQTVQTAEIRIFGGKMAEILKKKSRSWKFSFKALLVHVTLSVILMALLAVLVFGVWYPKPYFDLMGSWHLLLMIAGVDLVCGPILTFVAANSNKPKSELVRDFSIIAIVQLCAFAYGVYALAQSRPVADIFDKDRFYVAAAGQINQEKLKDAPEGMRELPLFGILKGGARKAANQEEFVSGLDMSLSGIPPAVRPNWWVTEKDADAAITKAKIPLENLFAAKPAVKAEVENRLDGRNAADLYYLPFTAEKNWDWIVVLDRDNRRIAYVPVDGFVEK